MPRRASGMPSVSAAVAPPGWFLLAPSPSPQSSPQTGPETAVVDGHVVYLFRVPIGMRVPFPLFCVRLTHPLSRGDLVIWISGEIAS